jgi:hypothetical protein
MPECQFSGNCAGNHGENCMTKQNIKLTHMVKAAG